MENKLSLRRKAYILTMKWLMRICAGLTFGLVIFLIAYIFIKGVPGLSWDFVSTVPTIIPHHIGILPDILNTVYIVLASIIIVVPLGAGAAVYLTEYAKNKPFPEYPLLYTVLWECYFSVNFLKCKPRLLPVLLPLLL